MSIVHFSFFSVTPFKINIFIVHSAIQYFPELIVQLKKDDPSEEKLSKKCTIKCVCRLGFSEKSNFEKRKILTVTSNVVKNSFVWMAQIHPTYLAHFALLQIVPCCCGTRKISRRKIANLCALT